MAQRPQVIAFDTIDTIVDMLPLEQPLKMLGLPTGSLRLWLTQTVRDGFALSIVGEHRSFGEVASSALVSILQQFGVIPSAPKVQEIMEVILDLPAHPDAEPAIRAARERGARVIALTNGTAEAVERLMRKLGLADLMEQIISADHVQRWKPHPEPYHYAASQLGVEPGQMALVTVHGWDALGAKCAGLTAGWAGRLERHFPAALGAPDVAGANLQEVVTRLMALEAGPMREAA